MSRVDSFQTTQQPTTVVTQVVANTSAMGRDRLCSVYPMSVELSASNSSSTSIQPQYPTAKPISVPASRHQHRWCSAFQPRVAVSHADARNRNRSRLQSFLVETLQSAQIVSSSDQADSQHHSVFLSPVFHHTNRRHVIPVAPKVYQPFSLGPLLYWTPRDERSWCQRATSTANHGSTKENVVPSLRCR